MTTTIDPAHMPGVAASGVRIGVFDSGVGGLSVLGAIHRGLPGHWMHYVADSAHAPYGEREEGHVIERSTCITRHLIDQRANVIVIACNTATALAAQRLRETWPQVPFVGVEPGIKPALALSKRGRIAVMATSGTLASDKFRKLVALHQGDEFVHLQACPGLAAAIERGDLGHPEIEALIERYCQPIREADVDTVVLGCTHYPFVEPLIRRALGAQVQIVDTAEAIARRVAQVVHARYGHIETIANGRVLLETTGDAALLDRFARHWLSFDFQTGRATFDDLSDGARDGD